MSDSIPPFLSSTPPPFDDDGQENDDFGEFADFTTVAAVPLDASITVSSNDFRPVDFASELNSDENLVKSHVFTTEPTPSGNVEQDQFCPSADDENKDNVWSEFSESSITHADISNGYLANAESTAGSCDISSKNILHHEVETVPASVLDISESAAEIVSSDNVTSEDILAVKSELGILHTALANGNQTVGISANLEMAELQSKVEDTYVSGTVSYTNRADELDNKCTFDDVVDYDSSAKHESSDISKAPEVLKHEVEEATIPDGGLDSNSCEEDEQSDDFQLQKSEHDDFKTEIETVEKSNDEDEFSNFESATKISQDPDSSTSEPLFAEDNCSNAELQVVNDSFDKAELSSDFVGHIDEVLDKSKDLKQSTIYEASSGTNFAEQELQDTVDDEFDDFEEFKMATSTDEKVQPLTGDDEWSAFNTNETAGSSGDDWAAFQEPQAVPEAATAVSGGLPVVQSADSFSGSSKVLLCHSLHACFPNNIPKLTEQPCDIHSLRKVLGISAQPSNTINSVEQHGRNVWNELKVMENTAALKYQWGCSRTNDLLLKAINVDARNTLLTRRLGKPSAPPFAMGMGLLEPEKATSDQMKITSNSSFVSSYSSTSKDQGHAGKSGNRHGTSTSNSERKPDRDFFDVLERNDNCRPVPNSGSIALPKSLDNILASISSSKPSSAGTMTTARKTTVNTSSEPLSAEAASVLSHLPDLSFMHAKVLMFPVSDCAN